MIKGKKIFITGGAGFIASTIIARLADDNEITVFDNYTRDSLNKTEYGTHPNVRQVRGDVLDADAISRAIGQAQIVVHAAAIAGIGATIADPVTTMRVNMLGAANVLEAAMRLGSIERFLAFSTSEVFGNFAYKVEETSLTSMGSVGEARWTYAVSKLAIEHLTHAYYKQHQLPTVTVRPFNVYGPGQIGEGAISIFMRKAMRNEDLFVFGEGSQIRAWCYVDDMVDAVIAALTHPRAIGESFNIGNPRAVVTIHGLAEAVIRATGSRSKIVFKPPLSADIELRVPKVDKARELIEFEARVDLDEGLRRTGAWIEANADRFPELSAMFRS